LKFPFHPLSFVIFNIGNFKRKKEKRMFKNYFSSDIFENFITVLGGIRTHYNSPIRSQMPYLLPPKAKNYKPFFINLYIN